MSSIRRKLLFMLMIFLLPSQTPTPIPTLTPMQAADDLTQAAQSAKAFSEALQTFTPLMVLALLLIVALVWILVIGRRQTNNLQPLLNSIEEDRKERRDLQAKLFERDQEHETRTIESVEALAIAQKNNNDYLNEVRTIVIAFNTRDMQGQAILDRLATAFEKMNESGSVPVQNIASTIEIFKMQGVRPDEAAREQLNRIENAVNEMKKCVEINQVMNADAAHVLDEARRLIELVNRDVQLRAEEKRKTDSRPIPAITIDPTDKQEGAQGAPAA